MARGVNAGLLFFGARVLDEHFSKDLAKIQRKLRRFGSDMERTGKQLSVAITAPVTGALGLALKEAIQFESGFAGVRKTVDATEKQFEQLSKGIRAMARTIPASTQEINRVAEAAGQLGVQTKDILGFTRVMIDLGNTTNLTSEQAADGLARFMNVMGTSADEVDNLGSALVGLGNNFAATEGEILAMGQRLAAAGKSIGLSEAEVLGFATALTSVGIEAEAGGSAFSKVFKQIQLEVETGGKQLALFAEVANMSIADFSRLFKEDAAEAVTRFIEGFFEIQQEGGSAIKTLDQLGLTEIRLSNALLSTANANDLVRRSLAQGTKDYSDNIALTKEAQQRYGTLESRLSVVWQRFKDIAITVGEDLTPTFSRLVGSIETALTHFEGLDKKTRQQYESFALVSSAVGPLLVGLGSLAKLLGGALLLKLTAVTLAVGTLATAFTSQFDSIEDATGFLVDSITGAFSVISEDLLSLAPNWVRSFATMENAVEALRVVFDVFVDYIKTLEGVVVGLIERWRQYADVVEGIAHNLKRLAQGQTPENLDKVISKIREARGATRAWTEEIEARVQGLQAERELEKKLEERAKARIEGAKAENELNKMLSERLLERDKKVTEERKRNLDKLDEAQKKTKDSLEAYNKELQATANENNLAKLKEAFERALESHDPGRIAEALSNYKEALYKATYEETKAAHEDAATDVAPLVVEKLKQPYDELNKQIFESARERIASELEEQQKAADEASAFWRDALQDAFDGSTRSLADMLKEVAIGFAAQMAAAIFGGPGVGSLKDLGASIANGVIGSFGSSLVGAGASGGSGGGVALSAGGSVLSALSGGGAVGPLTQTGSILSSLGLPHSLSLALGDILPGAAGAGGLFNALDELSRVGQSTEGTIKGLTTSIFTLGGAVFGGPFGAAAGSFAGDLWGDVLAGVAESAFGSGKGGRQLARDAYRDDLEQRGIVSSSVPGQAPASFQMFGGGYGSLAPGGKNYQLAQGNEEFSALGDIITALTAGTAHEQFNEFSNMWANALSGAESFNHAMITTLGVMDQLGEDVDSAKDKFTKAFLAGEIGLGQFGAAVGQLNVLAQENLVGEGSVLDALNIMGDALGPGGTPQTALKGLELAFKEASEIGEDQFEIVRSFITDRFGPDAADAFNAIKDVGITSFENFQNLSADQIFVLFDIIQHWGDAVVDVFSESTNTAASESESNFERISRAIEGITDKAYEARTAIEEIPDAPEIKGSSGGTSGDALDSQTDRTGRSSGATYVYNVDARESNPGVEERIMRSLQKTEDRAVLRATRMANAKQGRAA